MLYDMKNIMELITKAVRKTVQSMKPAEIVFGTVKSETPLQIFVDQKTILDQDFCHMSQAVQDYKTEIEFEADGILQIRSVTIKNGLHIGDKVRMLRYNEGQDFLILDRVVNV